MSVKPGDLIRINECEFGFPAYWNSAMCKFAGRSVEVFGTFDSCNNIVEVYDEEFDCLCVFITNPAPPCSLKGLLIHCRS